MTPTDAQQLQLSIIQALEATPDGQDLEHIHGALNRPRRDLGVLPQMSALIAGGYIEKIARPLGDSSNRPIGSAAPRRASASQAPRFRLTAEGRTLLASARAHGTLVPAQVPGSDADAADESDAGGDRG